MSTEPEPSKENAQANEAEAKAAEAPKSSPTKKESDNLNVAMQHLASGKRNLLVADIPAAVNELEEACRMMGEIYGETGVECAETYFQYGSALLELARMESGVIDNVPEVDSADNSTEEEEEVEEENKEEAKDETKSVDKDGDKPSEAKAAEEPEEKDKPEEEGKEEDKDGDGAENESIASNDAGTSDIKDKKDEQEIDQEEVEDPSNLQLSWEMLELAKSLFQKHADSLPAEDPKRLELESRLSETYQTLGELSIENENYPQAVEDLTCCLRRRQELLPEDSRCIAETHYQMGVALGFNLEFDKAVASLNDAIAVLEKRIANLKEKKESDDPSKAKDAFYSREREIAEIEGLIPEIREKIADTKDMQEETFKKLGDKAFMESGEMEAVSNGNGTSTVPTIATKTTSDISHMIKKRKKPEDSDEASSAKKPNISNGNGH